MKSTPFYAQQAEEEHRLLPVSGSNDFKRINIRSKRVHESFGVTPHECIPRVAMQLCKIEISLGTEERIVMFSAKSVYVLNKSIICVCVF